MSEFWEFAGEHWFIALLMVWLACGVIKAPFAYGFRAYNRKKRSENIALHGWPTAPMDADGDIVHPEKSS